MPTYTEVASGGVLAAGTAVPRVYYTPARSGGGRIAGTAARSSIYGPTCSGGLRMAGFGMDAAFLPSRGGAVVGSQVLSSFIYTPTHSGGGVLGGSSHIESTSYFYDPGDSPVEVAGEAVVSSGFGFEGDGTVVVGGAAVLRSDYHYVSDGSSSDAAPEFSGVSVGYLNEFNPTLVNFEINIDIQVKYRHDAYVTVDIPVVYNTGQQRLFWYQIIGKERSNICPPLKTADDCCRRFTMNISARSIGELCTKLRARNWKWPIESVQRFSRPAETAAVAEDALLGINHDCNALETVEICTTALCADFCIDEEVSETWGVTAEVDWLAFLDYSADGGVVMAGAAFARRFVGGVDYLFEGDGVITLGGAATAMPSHYGYSSSGGITTGGTPGLKSTHYDYVGGVWPSSSGSLIPTTINNGNKRFTTDEPWQLTERARNSDNLFASVDLSYFHGSQYLILKNFNLNVSEGREIVGFEVVVERKANAPVRDSDIYLIYNGNIQSRNLADTTTNWPIGSDAAKTYGGPLTTWLNDEDDPWDLDVINDPGFGIALRVAPISNSVPVIASIDSVTLKVYYELPAHDTVRVGGESGVRFSHYRYQGGGGIRMGRDVVVPFRINRHYISSGQGFIGPSYAAIRIGGDYGLAFRHVVAGGIELGGAGVAKSSYWATSGSGGISTAGEAAVVSPVWHYTPTGGTELAAEAVARTHFRYQSVGGVSVDGGGGLETAYRLQASGGIVMAGTCATTSSKYSYVPTGGPILDSDFQYNFNGLGDFEETIGVESEIAFSQYIFAATTAPDIVVPTTTINECTCNSMSLGLSFRQNLMAGNRLSQFLTRNNVVVPTSLKLHYNRPNDSWQTNLHFKGFSGTGTHRELWNLVYELQCTTNLGGQAIGQKIWKFSMHVLQRNLTTLEDYDTKLILGFLPDKVCQTDDFRATITVETQANYAFINPVSTIYHYVLYDNIGLFRNTYWTKNPQLVFAVSQVPFANPVLRVPLDLGV
jgi:hypothetical protein